METYLVETEHPDTNAEGGVVVRRWIVRAPDIGGVGSLTPGAAFKVVEKGGNLDARAAELGILEGGIELA